MKSLLMSYYLSCSLYRGSALTTIIWGPDCEMARYLPSPLNDKPSAVWLRETGWDGERERERGREGQREVEKEIDREKNKEEWKD